VRNQRKRQWRKKGYGIELEFAWDKERTRKEGKLKRVEKEKHGKLKRGGRLSRGRKFESGRLHFTDWRKVDPYRHFVEPTLDGSILVVIL